MSLVTGVDRNVITERDVFGVQLVGECTETVQRLHKSGAVIAQQQQFTVVAY